MVVKNIGIDFMNKRGNWRKYRLDNMLLEPGIPVGPTRLGQNCNFASFVSGP